MQASMEVEHDETLKHRIEEVDETPHDAEAMDVEEFTMEGSVKVKIGEVLVKQIVKALKEVGPTFKRELLASRRRNSM